MTEDEKFELLMLAEYERQAMEAFIAQCREIEAGEIKTYGEGR